VSFYPAVPEIHDKNFLRWCIHVEVSCRLLSALRKEDRSKVILCYNATSLSETSYIASDIVCYQIIPHC